MELTDGGPNVFMKDETSYGKSFLHIDRKHKFVCLASDRDTGYAIMKKVYNVGAVPEVYRKLELSPSMGRNNKVVRENGEWIKD